MIKEIEYTYLMAEKTSHFGALDFYRFLAASGVFALHFSQYAGYDYTIGFGYAVGDFALFVDFFFILSGFVIGLNYSETVRTVPELLHFLTKRLARIYPMHILTLFTFFIPTILGISADPGKWNASSIVSELALIQSWSLHAPLPYNFVSWSISVEWAMYLLFPIIIFFYRRLGIFVLIILAVLGFSAIEFLLATDQFNPPLWFMVINPLRAIPTFTIGVLISQIFNRFRVPHGIWLGFSIFCFGIFSMVIHAPISISLTLFSLAVFFTASGYLSTTKTIFDNRLSLALGNSSYSLYMLHPIFLSTFFDKLWPKLNLGPVTFFFGVLAWLILIAVSIISFKYFETPMRKWMSPKKRHQTDGFNAFQLPR